MIHTYSNVYTPTSWKSKKGSLYRYVVIMLLTEVSNKSFYINYSRSLESNVYSNVSVFVF